MQQNLIQNRNSCLHLVVFREICITSLIATKFQLLNGHFSTLMKTCKCRDKLKEVCIEYPCAHHLDLTISIFTMYLLIPFIHPEWSYLRLPFSCGVPKGAFYLIFTSCSVLDIILGARKTNTQHILCIPDYVYGRLSCKIKLVGQSRIFQFSCYI